MFLGVYMCACIFICIYTCICISLEKRISIDRDCKIRSLRRKTLQIWAYCTPGIYVPGKNKQKMTKRHNKVYSQKASLILLWGICNEKSEGKWQGTGDLKFNSKFWNIYFIKREKKKTKRFLPLIIIIINMTGLPC